MSLGRRGPSASVGAKRTAFVIDAVYPVNKGGRERRLWETARRLARDGHDVRVFTMKWWSGPRPIELDGVMAQIPPPPSRSSPLNDTRAAIWCRGLETLDRASSHDWFGRHALLSAHQRTPNLLLAQQAPDRGVARGVGPRVLGEHRCSSPLALSQLTTSYSRSFSRPRMNTLTRKRAEVDIT